LQPAERDDSGADGANHRPRSLSSRQREVLESAAAGWTEGETALRLCVARATVDYHLCRARSKLGSRTTTQAVARAVAWGIIEVI
jgi:DNA-binding NarL/FixJ family response regulator